MQRLDGRLVVSASDLVGFLGCEHLSVLDQDVALVLAALDGEGELGSMLEDGDRLRLLATRPYIDEVDFWQPSGGIEFESEQDREPGDPAVCGKA